MERRVLLVPFIIAAGISTLFLFSVFQNASWRSIPQAAGLARPYGPTAQQIASGEAILPDLRKTRPVGTDLHPNLTTEEPTFDLESPYPLGVPKAPGSAYTRTLVISSTKSENTSWVEPELGDMIEAGLLNTAIYVANDWSAPLHPPRNKGHEAMVYLTYIIDHYDSLADVSIFMHAHQFAWHNDELLDRDAAQMIRLLSPERVTRLGYMNLRCSWEPGCPNWLHPGAAVLDDEKREERIMATQWAELFPDDPIPPVLSSACCAQFAVSRERILALPRKRYMDLRDWIDRTKLNDYLSGRVFEYLWHYIFTGAAVDCPSMSACYCDGFGVCMGSPAAFDYFFELRYDFEALKQELRRWWEQADLIEEFRKHSRDGRQPEDAHLQIPEPGRDQLLSKAIAELWVELQGRRKAALELGRNPAQRAFEAGREWKEGDGF